MLVVADPAEDAHLPGAEEEGAEVAALFEGFNAVYEHSSYSRVEAAAEPDSQREKEAEPQADFTEHM